MAPRHRRPPRTPALVFKAIGTLASARDPDREPPGEVARWRDSCGTIIIQQVEV